MEQNRADAVAPSRVWLIAHERDNPMVLMQQEYSRDDAVRALQEALGQFSSKGFKISPNRPTEQLGRRYDVSDANGWYATYWLSEEEIPEQEGVLTAVVSVGSPHSHPRH